MRADPEPLVLLLLLAWGAVQVTVGLIALVRILVRVVDARCRRETCWLERYGDGLNVAMIGVVYLLAQGTHYF